MSNATNRTIRLHRDETGQTSIEYALLLAFIVLPLFFLFRLLLQILAAHYALITFFETLPFP